MSTERYVGERRALWHFLSELRPLVVASLGENALLRYRIERALKSGDLEQLRAARGMFHHLPEDLKRSLMRGIFEESTVDAASTETLSEEKSAFGAIETKPSAPIRFSAIPAARDEDVSLSVDLDDDVAGTAGPVQVVIEADTLPRSAAETLRQIANWIEHDRRLLSRQHWIRRDKGTNRSDESLDQA